MLRALASDHLQTTLKIVAALTDGSVRVPGIHEAALTAVQISEIAQTVTKNKEDAIEVAKSITDRTSALVEIFRGKCTNDIPQDIQQDIARYAGKLEKVQAILQNTAHTGFWRRVVARSSNRDEIIKCKAIMVDAFEVLSLALQVKLHLRLPDELERLRSCLVSQINPAPCRLSVVRREELDFSEYWALDGNTEVVCAEYNGNNVVVKKYRSNKKQWVADRDAWLCLGVRPHYLQLIGQSDESACSLHLVFRDPGVPVQTYIERGCRDSVKKCTMDVLTMVIQFAGAAIGLLHKDHGGCKIDTANICLRSMGGNALKGLNFVIADFDPSRVYGPTDNDPKIDSDAWDIFVNLITKAITGKLTRPNYVVGDHGETGPTVTRVFRFLIHFLVDFPYHEDRQHDALDQKFKKLTSNMRTVQDDVERFDPPQNRNPLLDCMQPYYSDLCAIWDLWHVLPVAPGDLGIMVPGGDARRPVFKKITNIAGEMNEWLSEQGKTQLVATSYPAEYAEQRYVPPDGDPAFWSSEVINTSTIRHRLRLGRAPPTTLAFGCFRARRLSLLGSSFDYHASWSYLRHLHETDELSPLAAEHNIHPADLMFIFSTSEHKGYAHLVFNSADQRDALLAEVGAQDGVLYYFENLDAAEGELHGYWSAAEMPGTPLWGATPLAPGSEWGWEYSGNGFNVEIARKGPAQHIRYVSL